MATKFDPKYFDSFSANDHSERLLNLDALYEKLCERLVFAEESCIPQEIGSDDQDACCHMLEIIKKDIYDNCDSEETVHGPNDVDAHFSQMISLFLKVDFRAGLRLDLRRDRDFRAGLRLDLRRDRAFLNFCTNAVIPPGGNF